MMAARRAAQAAWPPQASALDRLVDRIADACRAPMAARDAQMKVALCGAVGDPHLLRPDQCTAADGCYQRHRLHADPGGRFSILAIVWKAGQFSPIHGHRTWCSYAVHRGSLVEIAYEVEAASGETRQTEARLRTKGDFCFSPAGLGDIHRLGNPGGEPAISIHVYGVGAADLTTGVNWVLGP